MLPPTSSVTIDPPPTGLLPTVIIACSGASDAGSVADRAARALVRSGVGRLVCLAAVATGEAVSLSALREAARVLVISGCSCTCVERLLTPLVDDGKVVRVSLDDFGLPRDGAPVDDRTIIAVAARSERILLASCRGESRPAFAKPLVTLRTP